MWSFAARSGWGKAMANFSAALLVGILSMQASYAGPEGGRVVRGEGRIVRPDARTTNIQQDSHLLVVDWDSFNVARDETVNFLQPSADAAALNRIFDQDPSEIFGTINANGRVLLVNPNGLLFGRSASVNVGSLIVSGLNIDADDFMAGDWTFENAGSATGGLVINHGLLQAAEGGSVSLFGGAVQNTGAIVADFGTINLAAGKQVTIDFDGDGLIQFAVDGELIENAHGLTSAVSNSGSLQAESGRILMSASAANDVFAQVVNNSGIVSASGVVADGGRVFLTGTGGDVVNTGSITATSQTGKGGEVRVLGDRVGLFDEARVDVSGASGGGTALIGGAYQGGSGVLASSHTVVGSNAVISADAWESGHGGTIIVWADGLTQFFGAISARGGALAGDGGFVEVSGKEFLAYRGNVDTSAANGAMGTLLLDPADIVIAGGTGGADDAEVGDGTVNFADGAAGTFTISEAAIESTDANIILQATNSITVSGTFDNASGNGGDANGVLALMDGRSLSLETSNGAGEGSGGIDLTGSAHGTALVIRTNAGGDITLTAGSNGGDAGTASIAAGSLATGDRGDGNTGDITLDAEGDVSINAAATGSVTAGSSDRTSGFIDITSGGNITAGTLATGGVTVAGNGDSATSGNITLNAAGNVLIGGNVATGAATVNDDGASTGDISITSTGGTITTTSAGMISTGNAAGDDQATNSGAIVLDAFSGMTLDAAVATGNASLNGGSTTATSGGITLSSDSGNIAATGPVTTGDADTDQSAATTGAIGITASNGELQLAGVASGDATVIGGDFDATSGSVTLESTASNVLLNGAIVSGQANSAERNATAGDIDVTAGGAITGNVTGTITTGDASGHGQGGDEFATSGSITMNAANAIAMAAANALATGNATLTTGTGSPAADFATVGDIAITAASISSDGANGALDVSIGSGILMTAEGGVVEGELVAITDGGAGDAGGIFITSGENLRVADIDTDGAVAQNVNISVTGGADLDILAMTTETLSGDAIVFGAETGTLTFSDTAFDVGAGSLVLTGDEIDLAVDAGSISGTGAVTLRASTLANDIRVGDDADSAIATTLDLTDADLAALADGFAGITIGRSDATGTLSIDVDGVLFNDAIALEMSSGNVALEGDVLTAGDTITINATGIELDTAGAIAIDATNGGAVPAGANIAINGAMADAMNDSSITVNAGTGGTLDLDSVTTGLGQSYTASNIDLNGTAYQSTTSGAITFNGTVDLDNGGTIAVQTAGAGGDDITFSSTIDGASTLQLQAGAGGNIDIANGAVGGTTALSALTVTSAGSLAIGTATADGAISLAATSIDGSGGNIVLASNAANIAVNGAVTTNGNDIGITAASGVTTTGSIVTAAAADSGLASGTVGINVTATGDILVANIDTSGADSTIDGTSASDAGAITLATTDGSITTTGAIDASGGNLADGSNATTVDNGGAAAAVSLTTASTGAAADIMLGGTVTARGGTTDNAGGAAGADATITLDAAEDVIGSGGLDIDAGALALTAGGNGGALTTQVAALSANAETGFNITNTGDLVATLTANNGTAVLGNTGTVTTGGAWTANVFDIDASGAITLDHTVTSDVGGIDIASSADATTVNANVTSAMQALVSAVGVTNSATITGNAGVTINAGAGTFTNTATTGIVQSDGTTDVLVIADDADLQAASSIDAGTGTLTIRAATGGQALNLGTASVAADLDIDNTEIGTVTAGLVQLGDTTVTGAVTADNFDAGALNMRVASSATIDDAGTGVNHITTAGTLDLQAAGAIGGGNTDGLSIDAGSVTAAVSGAGNAISLGAYDADETGANGTPANITVGAGGITTNNGNVILGAADDIMLTGGINAGTGTIALTAHAALDGAAETTASGAINGAGTLTGSAITLRAAGGIGDTIALDTASTNIDADTLAGAVDINNTSAADATVTLASGDSSVTFDQAGAGNLLLDTVNAATTATLSSAAAINDSAADTTTDVTATAVSLTAGTGIGASGDVDLAAASIGAASTTGAIDINNAATAATTVTNLATDGANISFTQAGGQTLDVQQAATTTSGDISISNDSAALTAGSGAGITSAGNVTLATTTSGDIVLSDVSGTTVSVNSAGNINDGAAVAATVAAASLELIAASGIADLDIDADTLAATTASGDLTVTDSDALEIGSVGGTSGIAITGGTANNIVITAGGALTTTGAATDEISNQFGDISLAGASIGTLATPLRVSLDAAGVLNLDSGASIFVTSPSSLSLGAVSTGAGADDVSIGISATTATLDLTQALDAGTDADLSGDNLAFAIAGTTLPTAPANDSTFDNNGFAIDVDGGSLSITADTINLAGTVEATGGISISAADEGSTIGLGNAGSAAVAGQNFVLTNATLLTLLGASGGSLIVGDASSGNVIMDGVDISTITNGTLTVVTGGTIADDDLVAGHGFVGGGDDSLVLTSDGIIDNLSVNAGTIDVISSGGNDVSLDIFSDLANVEVSARTGGAGNVDITQNNDVLATFSNMRVGDIDTTGTVTLTNNAGSISESSIADAGVDIAGSSISLTASGGIGAGFPLELASANISADANGGAVLLNNDATGLGSVTVSNLSATTNVNFTQAGGEDLVITAASGATGVSVSNDGGNLTATSITVSDVNSDISLQTLNSGDILLGSVTAPNAVFVNSAGAIEESGADATAEIATASVNLDAVSGIGNAAALELAVSGLIDATNSGTGNIALVNDGAGGAYSSAELYNENGNISFTDTGNHALIVSAVTNASGDIALASGTGFDLGLVDVDSAGAVDATAGAQLVFEQAAAGSDMTLTAASGISELDLPGGGLVDDGVADLVADTVSLQVTGDGNIGIAGDPSRAVEIDAVNVSAQVDGTAGQINIENFRGDTAATTVTNLSLAGAGDIEYAQTGGANVTFQGVSTTDGNITLANDGANLVADSVTAASVVNPGDVTLATTTGGTISVGSITAAGTVSISSAADVIESTNATTTDITASSVAINAQTGVGTTANGAIDINAATIGATTAAGGIDLHAAGPVSVTFSNVDANAGNVRLTVDGGNLLAGIVTADAGDVRLETVTSGDIALGSITASADATAISAGAINENANDGTADITAATATLSAQSGIGADANGSLDISIATVDSASTVTGGINLATLGATTFSSVTTTGVASDIDIDGTGNTTVTAASTTDGSIGFGITSGNLVAGTITAGGAGQGVFLGTATSGDITLGDVTATDAVIIDSAGRINDDAGGADTDADATGASVSLSAVNGMGDTDRVEVDAPSLSASNTTTGDVVLGVLGDVTLSGAISNSATGGGLDLTAIDGHLDTGTGLLSTQGGDITLTATDNGSGGNLVVGTGGIDTNGAALVALNAADNIVLNGNVTSAGGTIDANAGDNALEAVADSTGSINGAGVLAAAGIDLAAATGIGNGGTLNVDADVLVANVSATGAIDIADSDSVQLGDAGAGIGAADGDITITAAGLITSGNSIDAGAANVVDISTTTGRITLSHAVSSQGGDIVIASGNGTLTTTGVTTTGTGAITLTANDNGSAAAVLVNGTVGTGSGGIVIAAADTVSIGASVTTTGNVSVTADDGTRDAAAENIGSISGGGLVSGNQVSLAAAQGVSANTAATTLSVTNTSSGAVAVTEADDVTFATNMSNQAAGEALSVTTLDGAIDTGTAAVSTSDGTITLVAGDAGANDGSITVGSGGIDSGSVNAGDVSLAAADGVTLTGSVNASGTTTSGNVAIEADSDSDSAGAINGAGLVTASMVDLDAGSGIGNMAALELAAAVVTADTTNGAIDIDNTLATAVAVNSLTTDAGTITFDQSGGGAVTFDTVTTTTAGAIDLENTAGDLAVGTAVTANGASNVTLTANGGITLTGTTSAAGAQAIIDATGAINGAGLVTADVVDLDAGSGIGNTTALELAASTVTADTATGAIDIDNALATAVSVSSLTTDTGTITFDQSGGGDVTFDTVTTTTSGTIDLENTAGGLVIGTAVTANGASNVTLTANGAITLTGTTSAAGAQATIDATGAINGAGLVTASTVDLDAGSGIGNTTQLELAASTITADTATGAIDIDNALATAVSVSSLTTDSGAITFDQSGGGAVTFGNVTTTTSGAIDLENAAGNLVIGTAATANGASNVTLTTGGAGNVILTGTTNAAGDQVTISSAGSISGPGLVTAAIVDLGAVAGISANTATDTLTVDNTTSGDVNIVETDDVTLATRFRNLAAGAQLTLISNDGDIDTSTAAVSSNDGFIGIAALDASNTGATLTIGSGGLDSGSTNAGDITLYGADGIALGGNVDASGGTTSGDVTMNANFGDGTADVVGAITRTAGTASGNAMSLSAASGIDVNIASATLAVDNTGSGNVSVTEADGVTFATAVRNQALNGTLSVTTTDGAIDTSTAAVSTNDGALTLAAGDAGANNGGITIGTGGVDSGSANAGDVFLDAADGVTLTGNIDASGTTTSGDIAIEADDDGDNAGAIAGGGTLTAQALAVNAATGIGTTGAGRINVSAADIDATNTTAGGIFIANASGADVTFGTVDAQAAGDIELFADGDMHLGAVSGTASVHVESTAGSVLDAQDDESMVADVSGSDITLVATGDIGGIDPVTPGVDPEGELEVNASASLALNAQDVFVDDVGGNSVTLDFDGANFSYSSSGDILVGLIDATGTVSLATDGGSINDATVDAVTDILGTTVTLTARDEIGGGASALGVGDTRGAIEISSSSLDASVTTAGDIVLHDTGGTTLADIDTVSGAIDIDSDSALVAADVRTLGGTAADDITLAAASLQLGTVNAGAAGMLLATANAIDVTGVVTAADATMDANGGAGGITDNGGHLVVSGTTTLLAQATDTIVLDDANNDFNTVIVDDGVAGADAAAVTIVDTNDVNLGAATIAGHYDVTADAVDVTGTVTTGSLDVDVSGGTGDIVDSTGTLTIAGASTFTVASGSDVLLDAAANDFDSNDTGDAVSVAGTAGIVTLADEDAIVLGDITATTLNVTASGAITDDGTGNLVIGDTATFAAGAGNDIALDVGTNDFDTVVVTSGNNVTFADANGILLDDANVAGTYDVTADAIDVTGTVAANALDFDVSGGTGDITDSTGTLAVSLGSTFTAGASNVTLDGANDFNTVTIASGNDVTLNDATGIDLGATDIAGDLAVTAAGTLATSGNITADGSVSLTANGAGSSITMADGDVIDTSGGTGSVTLTADTNVALSRVVSGSSVDVTATNGAISDNFTVAEEVAGSENIVGTVATLNAATGIGAYVAGGNHAGDIDTNVDELTAVLSADGDIGIYETDSLYINEMFTALTAGNELVIEAVGNIDDHADDGIVDITAMTGELIAGGNIGGDPQGATGLDTALELNISNLSMTAGGAIDVTDLGTGDVTLDFIGATDFAYSTVNRNILVGVIDVSSGPANDVTLETANGWIRDDGSDTTDIIATGTITLSAGAGIDDTNGVLNLDAPALDIQTGTGAVSVESSYAGGPVTVGNLVSGDSTVTFVHSGGQNLVISNIASAGHIDIDNTAGSLALGTLDSDAGTVSLDAAGITFNGAFDAAGPLIANSTGAVDVNDTVSAASIVMGATTTISVDGAMTSTVGDIALDGDGITVNDTLDANALFSADSTDLVDINADVSAGSMDIDADTTLDINANLASSGTIALDSAGTTTLAGGGAINAGGAVTFGATEAGALSLGGSITTTGDPVTFNNAVNLVGSSSVSTGNGAVRFADTVDGAHTLNVNAGSGTVDLDAAVGGGTALAALGVSGGAVNVAGGISSSGAIDVANTGTLTLTAGSVINGSSFTQSGGAVSLGADIVTGGVIDIGGNVTLTDNVSLDTTVASTVRLRGTVAGGGNDLAIDAGGGTARFDGAISGVGAFGVAGGAASDVNADISAGTISLSGDADLGSNVDLRSAGAVTIAGSVHLGGSGTSVIEGGGEATVSLGAVTASGSQSLLASSEGNLALSSVALNGGSFTGQVDADGDTNFSTLTATTLNAADVTVSGGADGNDRFNIGVITATGDVTIGSDIRLATSLAITSADDVTLSGDLAGNSGVSLTVDNGGTFAIDGDITLANAALTIEGPATFGGDLALSTGSGAMSLGDISGSGQLALSSGGTLTLAGDVDVGMFDAGNMSGRLEVDGDVSISTDDTAIDLRPFSSVQAAAGGGSLALSAGSANVAAGSVGTTQSLDSFSASGGEISVRNVVTSGGQDYNGTLVANGALEAGGQVDVNGDLQLAGDVAITGSRIDIDGAIDGGNDLDLAASGGNVDLGGAVGASEALASLGIVAGTASIGAVRTTGAQDYNADMTLGGNLAGSRTDFERGVQVPVDVIIEADAINFNGSTSSVRGNGELTLLPLTENMDVALGGSGTGVELNGDALQGYDGGLVIGGIIGANGSITTRAGLVTTQGDFSVGENGYLTLISREGISLGAGTISGDTVTLIAGTQDGTIRNDAERAADSLVQANDLILVAGGQIGDPAGNDVNIISLSGPGTLEVASGASEARINNIGNTMIELQNPTRAIAISNALQLVIVDVNVTSSAQNSANREQSGGLADEGFIDPSLFEDIALYEVSGTGIALPADQSEEEMFDEGPAMECDTEDETCEIEATGAVGVISPR